MSTRAERLILEYLDSAGGKASFTEIVTKVHAQMPWWVVMAFPSIVAALWKLEERGRVVSWWEPAIPGRKDRRRYYAVMGVKQP